MARYLEGAGDLAKEVERFMTAFFSPEGFDKVDDHIRNQAVSQLGHIINLAIRACPRGVQHTVRLNIVKEAVGKYCRVTMSEEVDERTQRTFHKIHITPRS